ncbi:Esterase [Glycine soja]
MKAANTLGVAYISRPNVTNQSTFALASSELTSPMEFPSITKFYNIPFVSSSLVILCIATTILNNPVMAKKQYYCDFPAIFNFGASNADTGGLAASFFVAAPKSPNGETYFGRPAGRFSDGRLIIDFLAEKFGLPYLSPYLDSLGTNFSSGASFATAGSTIIPQQNLRFSPFSLGIQYSQFQRFKPTTKFIRDQGGVFAALMPKEEYFQEALYTFDIGQNDLTAGFSGNMTLLQVNASIPDIIKSFTSNIKNIYNMGARSFWIHNTGPIGCLPLILVNFPSAERDSYDCAKAYNEVAQSFNHNLKEALAQLRTKLPLAAITYVDIYSAKYLLFKKPQKYGFELPHVACCGYGGKYNFSSSVGCGGTIKVNGNDIFVGSCERPSVRVVWDGTHYTEAANKLDRIEPEMSNSSVKHGDDIVYTVIAPSITCWAVKAQVNKIWKTIDNVNGSAIGRHTIECVFCDEYIKVIIDLVRDDNVDAPYLAIQHSRLQLGAKTVTQKSSIENAKIIIAQPVPPTILGASNADTGGMAAAAFSLPNSPNGETYFHRPSGRFSDGRIILDFIAESFGIPYLSPYLDSLGSNFSRGANFATFGSTIKPQQNIFLKNLLSPFNLGVQYTQFNGFKPKTQLIRNQGGTFASLMPKEEYFTEALYTFDIGQNDLMAGIFSKTVPLITASIPDLVMTFKLNIKDASGCVKEYNEVAQDFNRHLKDALAKLREDLPLAAITYVDVYTPKYNLFSDPKKYGFELPHVTCCGYGGKYNFNDVARCGATMKVMNKDILVGSCKTPSTRVVWDGIHYTEAANKVIFDQISSGNFTDPPIPLKMACNRNLA